MLRRQLANPPWLKTFRKLSIYAGSFLVVAYVLAVIYHAGRRPGLGIDCLFTPVDARQSQEATPGITVAWTNLDAADVIGPAPRQGDRILSVADRPVPTFLHFKRLVVRLGKEAVGGDARGSTSDVAHESTASLAASLGDPLRAEQGPSVLDIDGQRWVRIRFAPETAPSTGDAQRLPNSEVSWLRLTPVSWSDLAPSVSWSMMAMVIFLIGAIIVWRRPGDRSAVLFFALSAVYVVTFMGMFHWSRLVGNRLLLYPFVLGSMLLAPMTVNFYLLFPRPTKLIRQRPRLALASVYALPVVGIVMMFSQLLMLHWMYGRGAAAVDVDAALHQLTLMIYAYLSLSMAYFLVGLGVLLNGLKNLRARSHRNQLRWILWAIVVSSPAVLYLLYLAIWNRPQFAFGSATQWIVYLVSVLFASAYAVSMTRYKLLEVGQVMNRGLLHVVISLSALALYSLTVGLGTALIGHYSLGWENALAAGLTAMLMVVMASWIRDRIQKSLDRRFLRDKYQLETALRRMGRAVEQLVEPAQLAQQLLFSACDAVGAIRGVVYLKEKQRADFHSVARIGWPQAPAQMESDCPIAWELQSTALLSSRIGLAVLPSVGQQQLRDLDGDLAVAVELQGRILGIVVLGPKADESPYSAEDRNFLNALAQTTALALRSARGHRTIDALNDKLRSKLDKIAEQQQHISFLQGELLRHTGSTRNETRRSRSEDLRQKSITPDHGIRGSSPAVTRLLDQVLRIADSSASVLVRGESGTGKELLARAIHDNSPRAQGPFVAVHCAALSPGLLESELFGHVKGAFTGADRKRPGRFELASGGTLFLDEIGDISPEIQTKLLRVLQERCFERVGGIETIQTDVRLITATHRDLEQMISQGQFREDLFYRLNVISLCCPALRQRPEDIFELALYFVRLHSQQIEKSITGIDNAALEALARYDWPGNVRQLENAMQRAVIMAQGPRITRGDLPPEVTARRSSMRPGQQETMSRVPARVGANSESEMPEVLLGGARGSSPPVMTSQITGLPDELETLQRQRLIEALQQTGGNKSKAARLLGMPRSTFFSKLRKLGLG